ncbi:Na+/H+ antiporter NhaC family protein [Gemmatimonadota bacterium]
MDPNWTSLVPPLLAVVLAFVLRDAVVSLLLACVVGVVLMGQGLQGFPALLTRALGTPDFIWVCTIELAIGALVAFLQRSGAVDLFRAWVSKVVSTRKQVGALGWGMGLSVFFSDYFSPLFVGAVMRDLTDQHRISREKLAYICDSTSAAVISLVPFSAWAVYMSGMAANSGLGDTDAGIRLFIRSVPFNLYSILTVIMVGLIVLQIVPDFGPMRRAEERAIRTGKVLADGALPMMGKELTSIDPADSDRPSIAVNFFLPVLLIVTTNLVTFITQGTPAVLESFLLAVAVLGVTMWLQRLDSIRGLVQTALAGMKGVMGAVVILALAYCINRVSTEMQTAAYVVELTEDIMGPALLPLLAFIIAGFVSFSTGTSWGTYAIMIPIVLPLAIEFSGDPAGPLVLASFAAVAGGGVFGDHCSPLSDTTVLSSLGSACDHMDHTRTQVPYALTVAFVVALFYLGLGLAVTR